MKDFPTGRHGVAVLLSAEGQERHDDPTDHRSGVDGSDASNHALRTALEDTQARGGAVRVITAWSWTGQYSAEMMFAAPDLSPREATQIQERSVARVLQKLTAPPFIDRHLVEGSPGPSLLKASRGADYLVVGSEHKEFLKRTAIGSTSEYCVQHSDIPVLVVPLVDRELHSPVNRGDR